MKFCIALITIPVFAAFTIRPSRVAVSEISPKKQSYLSSGENTPDTPLSNADAFASPPAAEESPDDSSFLDTLAAESAATAFKTKIDFSDMVPKERKAPRQAGWFPMLLSPAPLDGSLAGDVGFDPLGFAPNKEALYKMREAEVKHSRLAMLGAVGWPMSELYHKQIASAMDLDSILVSGDRVPSVLNGGLSNVWIGAAAAVALLIGGLLEFKTFESREKEGSKPGDLGFDPLRLHTFRSSFGLDKITENLTRQQKLDNAKKDMELCEIKNGRLAMIAMTGFAAQEFVTGISVVEQTPFFFGDPIM